VGPGGNVLGRGICSYGCKEADSIKGLRSDQIRKVLGEKGEEIVHRDELVMYRGEKTEGKA
jgi:glutamate 5-kinase